MRAAPFGSNVKRRCGVSVWTLHPINPHTLTHAQQIQRAAGFEESLFVLRPLNIYSL